MKIKSSMIMLVFAALAVNLHAASSALPAPLPEFMNQQQLATWNAEHASARQAVASAQETSTQFYTGKPYVADAGGYVYKCRTYNPEIAEWTSGDPMGFPDGPNSYRYYPNPVSSFDYAGCFDWVDGEAGIIGMEAGEGVYATGLLALNAAVVAIVADPPVGGSLASAAANAAASGTSAMGLGLVGINAGFGDTTTWISTGYGSNVTSSVNGIANALAFDVGVAQGYIDPLTSLGDEAKAEGHTTIANAFYAAAGVLTAAFVDPEQTMATTLNGERSLIPSVDSDGDNGFE